jgi:hypothetical protein
MKIRRRLNWFMCTSASLVVVHRGAKIQMGCLTPLVFFIARSVDMKVP